ncbi:putative NAD(P)H nitroreductase [Paenibacillus sp. UNCCL117]|uniref:nitroreductase family protein n=1 Tax=unclassified Paenibacillus TaxID=185978 RepID=UPI00088FBFED|nr:MULTISPECIES: nitroreductase family protein [unclassified Paenibacillus]SDE28958.1 putative NAD(P)H nitroreductase [Paenibacillus sp. cl123]SFW63365.1 putative NAD(P)H nitroreductase [Paenibacillus sp. UNCCL117]
MTTTTYDLTALVKARRSANKFIPGVEINDRQLEDIFQLAKFAPSAFNLQHTHYIAVRNPEVKAKVYEAAYKQYKVSSASALIVVLGHKEAYRDVARLNEGMLNLGILSQQEYDDTVQSVLSFYTDRGEAFKRDEAIRNASLSAMLLMLAAKDQGWDSCPMIGFDPDALREALHIPEDYVPALLIALGKEDTSRQRPRGYRKPVGEFVSYDRF